MKKIITAICVCISTLAFAEQGTVVYIDSTVIEESNNVAKASSLTIGATLGYLTAYLLPQFNTISRVGIGTAAGVISGYGSHEIIKAYAQDELIPAYVITIETNERIVCVTQRDLDGLHVGSKVILSGDKINGRL